jgi:hypothetical protein
MRRTALKIGRSIGKSTCCSTKAQSEMTRGMLENLADYHRVLIREYKIAIKMMESGKIVPHTIREGRSINTTQEIIDDLKRVILELEALSSKIERQR